MNCLDFVPVDNNYQDFDIANILQDIETENLKVAIPTPSQTPAVNIDIRQTSTPSNGTTMTNITNSISNQNNHFIPRMTFPHSNVTINYNINK